MSELTITTDRTAPVDDWSATVERLNRLLRLRTTPIGMKMFESVDEMQKVPRLRRPKDVHTTDQIVAQAARLGWTSPLLADPSRGLIMA